MHLLLLFTCMLNHGHIPLASIISILKNKNGDISNRNNYKPIAIITAMSKIFELCLSKMLDAYLWTSDHQFGFKKKHATDLCIYTVKSVVMYYNYFRSPVFTCFLDASTAFDRVNHWTLFKNLLLRDLPSRLVRILIRWSRIKTGYLHIWNFYYIFRNHKVIPFAITHRI